MERICSDRFEPTHLDVLRARVRTTGIIETCFQVNGIVFRYVWKSDCFEELFLAQSLDCKKLQAFLE